jgi:3,5-epimerase/4-reductase
MKVLLYGWRGWIGGQIMDILKTQEIEYICSKNRVNKYSDIYEEVKEHGITHIISTIGKTSGYVGDKLIPNIDYLEENGKLVENLNANLYIPIMIAMVAKEMNIHYTYMGTGCIFTYDDNDIDYKFTEEDEPNFTGSSYSTVKGYTEKLLKLYDNVLNVRIRMPITYDKHEKDFITKISKFNKICSIKNSMTVLDDLLPVMVDMLKKNKTGTINLVNPGVIEHNEILEMYKQYINKEHNWESISYDDIRKILKSDRSNNELSTIKLQEMYPDVPDIKTSIKRIFEYRSLN